MDGMQYILVMYWSLYGWDAVHPGNVLESLWMGCGNVVESL